MYIGQLSRYLTYTIMGIHLILNRIKRVLKKLYAFYYNLLLSKVHFVIKGNADNAFLIMMYSGKGIII